MVSVLLVGFLLAGLYSILFQTQIVFENAQDSLEVRQEGRIAVNQLVAELRMAGYGIDNLPEALIDARPYGLAFAADIDGGSPELPCDVAKESATDGGAERLIYRLEGGALLRNVDCWDGNAWTSQYADQPVARNVLGTQPIFRYYDASGTELVPGVLGILPLPILPGAQGLDADQREAVRTIRVELELEGSDPTAPHQPAPHFQIHTRVQLRNAG